MSNLVDSTMNLKMDSAIDLEIEPVEGDSEETIEVKLKVIIFLEPHIFAKAASFSQKLSIQLEPEFHLDPAMKDTASIHLSPNSSQQSYKIEQLSVVSG